MVNGWRSWRHWCFCGACWRRNSCVASFLHFSPGMNERRFNLLWGLFALFAACGAEEPPRLTAAGPRAAEIPSRTAPAAETGAMLVATGRQPYEGFASLRCVAHEEEGLQ